MGGKGSKEKKADAHVDSPNHHQASPQKTGNLSSMGINEYKSQTVSQPVKFSGTLVKSNNVIPKTAPVADMQRQYLQSLVELLIAAEPVRALVDDLDQPAIDLLAKNQKQTAFMKAFRSAIQNPTSANQVVQEVASWLTQIMKESSALHFDEPCLLMLCLSTSFKVLQLPQGNSIQDERPISKGLEGILQINWEDVENTVMQAPIQGLVEDLERLFHISSNGLQWNERIEAVRSKLEGVNSKTLTTDALKNFIGSIQNWVVSAPEDLETDENWSLVLPHLRNGIVKAINDKYYDISCFRPRSFYVEDGILLNTFKLGQNLSFGTLNFTENAFLSRYGKLYVQYYLEEKSVFTRVFDAALDLTIKGKRSNYPEIKSYLPTIDDLIKKLANLNNESDLINDFDAVGVYLGADKQFTLAYKDQMLFESCQQGNENGLRVYFTKNTSLLDEDTIKIILKSDTTYDSIAKFNYLVLAKRTDTVNVILDKIYAVNNYENSNEQLSESFKSHLLNKLIVSTVGVLPISSEDSAREFTQKLNLSYSKSIGEVLDKVRPNGREKGKIDLVFYINIDSQDYGGYLTPDTIDNEMDPSVRIPIKLELSKLFNLELKLANFSEEIVGTWNEVNIMEMLPNLLFVDIRNIQNIIEVPKEASVDIFKKAIAELDLPITNNYKAVGYLCTIEGTGSYCIRVIPNTKGDVTATFDGKTQNSTIDQLNVKYITGVLFERKLPVL